MAYDPGTALVWAGGYFGKSKDRQKHITSQVRIRRKTTAEGGSGSNEAVTKAFVDLTNKKDANGVETVVNCTVQNLALNQDQSESAPTTISTSAQVGEANERKLLPIDIEPDVNMAGVVGDVVKSAKEDSTVKHFVTPKKSDDLNQEYVELQAAGVDATQFDQMLVWEGGEAGSAANKRKVKRDTTGKTDVKIKTKQGDTVVVQMDVWVVWASQVIYWDRQDYQKLGATIPTGEGVTFISSAQEFVFEIEPKTIATEEKIPDLKGAAESYPPGTGATHLNDGHTIGRPKHKWDISRQYRCKVITLNFNKIWAFSITGNGGGIYANAVNTGTVAPVADFPQNPLDGNDDTETETTTRGEGEVGGENSNPYDELPSGVSKGQLYDSDLPSHPAVLDIPPPVGASLQVKLQFKQFCRLEVGKKWFLISSPSLWRHHAKLIKARTSDPNGDLFNGEVGAPRTGNGDW